MSVSAALQADTVALYKARKLSLGLDSTAGVLLRLHLYTIVSVAVRVGHMSQQRQVVRAEECHGTKQGSSLVA